ncbi:MAG: hypothetical protein ABI220_01705 [Candidatus Saccharimonadales bacterium]
MENKSPFLAIKQIDTMLKGILREIDLEELKAAEKKAIQSLKHQMVDTRLDIRDYELSETRDEQLKYAHEAKKGVAKAQALMLQADTVFGATDVAHLTARLDQTKDWLR